MMLTTKDAAARLNLTPQSVARLCKQGQIKATKQGRDYLIDEAELIRFAAINRPSHRPRKGTTMKTFRYTPIASANLTATDLRNESRQSSAYAYAITIYDANGLNPAAEQAEALYLPNEGRLGIAWGADATWADVKSLDSGIEMWLNDGDAWQAAN